MKLNIDERIDELDLYMYTTEIKQLISEVIDYVKPNEDDMGFSHVARRAIEVKQKNLGL